MVRWFPFRVSQYICEDNSYTFVKTFVYCMYVCVCACVCMYVCVCVLGENWETQSNGCQQSPVCVSVVCVSVVCVSVVCVSVVCV